MAAQQAFLEHWSHEGGEFPRFRLGLKEQEFKDWPDKVLATKDLPKDLVKVKDECTGKACKFFAAGYCKKRDCSRYSHDIEVCARAFPKMPLPGGLPEMFGPQRTGEQSQMPPPPPASQADGQPMRKRKKKGKVEIKLANQETGNKNEQTPQETTSSGGAASSGGAVYAVESSAATGSEEAKTEVEDQNWAEGVRKPKLPIRRFPYKGTDQRYNGPAAER